MRPLSRTRLSVVGDGAGSALASGRSIQRRCRVWARPRVQLPLACLTWAQLLVTLAAFQGVFLQLPSQHTPRGLGTPLGHMAGKTGLVEKGVEAADDLRC